MKQLFWPPLGWDIGYNTTGLSDQKVLFSARRANPMMQRKDKREGARGGGVGRGWGESHSTAKLKRKERTQVVSRVFVCMCVEAACVPFAVSACVALVSRRAPSFLPRVFVPHRLRLTHHTDFSFPPSLLPNPPTPHSLLSRPSACPRLPPSCRCPLISHPC